MAKIEFTRQHTDGEPKASQKIEVLAWGTGGSSRQEFYIGSGANFSAAANIWLEIAYTINDLPVYYTRNLLHHTLGHDQIPSLVEALDKFACGESDQFGLGDMLPETGIRITHTANRYTNEDDQEEIYHHYELEISADISAVFCESAPGNSFITIRLPYIELEQAVGFMRDLLSEIDLVQQGRHPDPAQLPPRASEWQFAREANRLAYDQLAPDYQEDYFANPALAGMFQAWLDQLPRAGRLLDAGCGHGHPVITRLLESGFEVAGIDLSPAMLERARQRFLHTPFYCLPVTQLEEEAAYDGVCSLSSLLYLDPVDLFRAIHRLHRALKPGGKLFLYAYDSNPNWRGIPYGRVMNQWMWGWRYGKDEAAQALEEHGYFKVLAVDEVTTPEEKETRLANWRKSAEEMHQKYLELYGHDDPPDLANPPAQGYCYALIAERQEV